MSPKVGNKKMSPKEGNKNMSPKEGNKKTSPKVGNKKTSPKEGNYSPPSEGLGVVSYRLAKRSILNPKDAEIIETKFMKSLFLRHIILGKIIFDAII
ncbi:MAG: hypothetical protein LBC74_14070 [Planctomycetaceae bacterium]|jgi:hypothetical protein|nr:hypothetical protein [Planctomycetaceae bacterium]